MALFTPEQLAISLGNATSIQGRAIAQPTANATVPQFNGTSIVWVAIPTPDWANPGAIGSGARNTASFTWLSCNGMYDESTSTPGFYAGKRTGGTGYGGRCLFANGDSSQNWQIDTENGIFRWYTPGVVRMLLSVSTGLTIPVGNLAVTNGSISTGNNKVVIDNFGTVSAGQFQAQSSFTVATLPATSGYPASTMLWCSNGCKPGEASGSGTGAWVCPVGSTWKILNTTTTVTA